MDSRVWRRGWRAVVPSVVLAALLPAAGVGTGPCARAAAAAGENRAGVVVQFGEEAVREFCVAFRGESLSGFELLRRTGLPVVFEDHGGGSVAVCMIGSVGCDYPGKPCFCRCETTGACDFWGYFRLDRASGKWEFSELGAGATVVRDGDVEGWRWGRHENESGAPPGATLEAICKRGEQVRADAVVPVSAASRNAESARGPGTAAVIAAVVLVIALAIWWRGLARARRRDDPEAG